MISLVVHAFFNNIFLQATQADFNKVNQPHSYTACCFLNQGRHPLKHPALLLCLLGGLCAEIFSGNISHGAPLPALSPALSERDTAIIVDRLDLHAHEATPIVRTLLADYEHQWVAARTHLQSSASATSQGDPRLAYADQVRAFQATQRALAEVLSDNIELLLDEEQREQWASLQHEFWRLRRLRHGQLHGESLDLRLLADTSTPDMPSLQSSEVNAALMAWQAQLAGLLASREPFDCEGSPRYLSLVLNRRYEAALAWMTQWVEMRIAIRDLNLTTANTIKGLLDEADAAAFAADIAQRIAIHTPGGRQVDRIAAGVAADDSLPESMRTRVAAIYASYQNDTATLNAQRERIEQKIEPLAVLAPMQRRLGKDDAFADLADARQDNELNIQLHAQAALDDICTVLGDPLCATLTNQRHAGSPSIDRRVHPSGLPQGGRRLRDVPGGTRPTPFPPSKPPGQPTMPLPEGTHPVGPGGKPFPDPK